MLNPQYFYKNILVRGDFKTILVVQSLREGGLWFEGISSHFCRDCLCLEQRADIIKSGKPMILGFLGAYEL